MALPRRSAELGRYAGPQLQSGIAHGDAGVLEHQTPIVIDETALEIEDWSFVVATIQVAPSWKPVVVPSILTV
jgi:hypothetical protein